MMIQSADTAPSQRPATGRKGLHVRFVTRMTGDLRVAVVTAARRDGLTAGAWARRALMEKVELVSPMDARSGRPVRRPEEEIVALSSALRELATAAAALQHDDPSTARECLGRARTLLVPLILQRAER